MSEFEFSCPACGQNVFSAPANAGTEIACPACHASIIVPEAPAGSAVADVPTETDTPPPWTGYQASAVPQTSRLAIASLVCSLSSFITGIGWLPGIICGHLARSRMRRNSFLTGKGLATAGLAIGYLILMLEAGTAAVEVRCLSTAVKHGYENVRLDLTTNKVIITQAQSGTVSTNNPPGQPAQPATVATNNQPIKSAQSGWTDDIIRASFPNHRAGGKLHGLDFTVKSALFKNGVLRINAGNGMSVEISHGAAIEGRSYMIQPGDDRSTNPHVRMIWPEDGATRSEMFHQGYGMKLEFDQIKNQRITAKIYLCFPDDLKSYIAGTFVVRVIKPKQ